jgi:sterol desaturase/sphingolipid hydroxylase (fatty acid hydroxylase superfamily)
MLLIIFSVFAFCFLLERARPGWRLPDVKGRPVRVLALNAAQLSVVLLAGLTWERWFSSASLFHLSNHVSPTVGGLIAYFIATLLFYWWHRMRHENDALWLGFHQIHHRPH